MRMKGMDGEEEVELSEFESQVIDFFCDGVRLLGLPKSIGEIYGLLFVTQESLALDDIVERLGISKGSASQGLKSLRDLGAVKVSGESSVGRKVFYEPDVELKQLVGGFIKEQVMPHLGSGEKKLENLRKQVEEMPGNAKSDFYSGRIDRLGRWSKRARFVLPLLQKFLSK